MSIPVSRRRLRDLIASFGSTTVALWGDFVIDRFILGHPKRISREAPVLILDQRDESTVPGGGGNALVNLASLGARTIAIGAVGGSGGRALLQHFERAAIDTSGIIEVEDWETPTKTRVLAGFPHGVKQQIVRFDLESPILEQEDLRRRLAARAEPLLGRATACILSDYGYGSVAPDLVDPIRSQLSGTSIVTADSRFRVASYRGVTAATPNEEEAAAATGEALESSEEALDQGGSELLSRLDSEALLVTRGSRGYALFQPGEKPLRGPVHGSDQVADVTGAGDTVIATFTLALAVDATFAEAAALANIAGGLVVMKTGTATLSAGELQAAVDDAEGIAP